MSSGVLAVPSHVLPLEPVLQRSDISCGSAALATVLRWWGVRVDDQDLWPELRPRLPGGLRPSTIAEVARGRGFRSKVVQDTSLEAMCLALATGAPPILDVQAWDRPGENHCEDGHFVVLGGLSAGLAWLVDPGRGGWAWVRVSDLLPAWRDRAWPGEPCLDRVAVLVAGDRPAPGPAGQRLATPYF